MTLPLDVDRPRRQATLAWPREVEAPSATSRQETVDLLGVPIHAVSNSEALRQIEGWIAARERPRLVMTPDTTAVMQAQAARDLLDAYGRADLVTADGAGLVWASRQLGQPLPERVTGIDLMSRLCQRSADRCHRVFLLGSRPGIAHEAAQILHRWHPELSIAGTHHGYFGDHDADRIVDKINECHPDLLFVGMGVPRQEIWMSRHGPELNAPVVMGVGGSFDVLAGRVQRAPQGWQTLGLEWLWRAMLEPRRLWRARLIPPFMAQILRDRARLAPRQLTDAGRSGS